MLGGTVRAVWDAGWSREWALELIALDDECSQGRSRVGSGLVLDEISQETSRPSGSPADGPVRRTGSDVPGGSDRSPPRMESGGIPSGLARANRVRDDGKEIP